MSKRNYDENGNWSGYLVTVGLPGYIPNHYMHANTLKEARAYAKDEAMAFRDAGYTVTGSAKDGYHVHQGEDNDWQRINILPVTLSAKDVDLYRSIGEWFD